MAFKHVSVLLHETVDGLNVRPDGIYVDATLGGCGHAFEVCSRLGDKGRFVGIDQDADAIKAAGERLAGFGEKVTIIRSNYRDMKPQLQNIGVDKVDGIVLDLGVSSYQLDTAERGFSYRADAPLDMRMDRSNPLTAEFILNTYTRQEIAAILRDYGEERFSSQIAAKVVESRQIAPITTCGQFVDIIESSIPKKFRQNGPAARKSFQAIRIAVNEELEGLYDCVTGLTRRLKQGGRIAILTFHSLEDRIVKRAFNELEADCICPKSLPVCVCGKKKEIEVLTKKPVTASLKEIAINSRSKSAKLRVAQRISE